MARNHVLAEGPQARPLPGRPKAVADDQPCAAGNHDRAQLQGAVRQDHHPHLPLDAALGKGAGQPAQHGAVDSQDPNGAQLRM